jgi:anaerobic dimethyl sulfoxide reductase subunit B (iron-sulfur subunit)
MSKESMIWFEHEKCLQCHGCEVACRSWRGLAEGVRYRRVLNVWRGDYPNVKSHSVSIECLHCVDPECAAICPVKAIRKRESDGLVLADGDLCTGCRACLDGCFYAVPQFGPDGRMQMCDLCIVQTAREYGPPCVATCPGGALSLREVEIREKQRYQKTMLSLIKQSGTGSMQP